MIAHKEINRFSKIKAIAEVTIFEGAFLIFAWLFQSWDSSGYGWYSKIIMIILGIIGISIHWSKKQYHLVPISLKQSLRWALFIIALFGIPSILVIVIYVLSGQQFSVMKLLVDMIWFFIFVGFAEELFFRGYIQTRLNEVFTKKYDSIIGVKYQWTEGTLITAIFFFGIPHILVGVNPFTGSINISISIILIVIFACFLGVIFGVIREKTGSIVIPSILHGFIDFIVFSLGELIGFLYSNILVAVLIGIFFSSTFEKILQEDCSVNF
ncbi:MAG: CPBP family glutamic-type intramembrane protease [Candidatus Asgardarchaeia archaeon]